MLIVLLTLARRRSEGQWTDERYDRERRAGMSGSRFRTGDGIVSRGVDPRQGVVSVISARVVRDDDELIGIWQPIGAPSIKPELIRHIPGTPRRWVDGNWYLTPSVWTWAEVLVLVRPGEQRATWVRWSSDRTFQGWAVNMQSELTRTQFGFDHWDHQLDILVDPDRTWLWKDSDELELAVELGHMTREQAVRVRAVGEAAVRDIEANAWPYNAGFEDWAPDPSWTLPDLPPDWDDLSVVG